MELPKYAALQIHNSGKFMNRIRDDGKLPIDDDLRCAPYGFIPFTGDSLLSPHAKIEFQKSNSQQQDCCFHIRCCYTNRYWVSMTNDLINVGRAVVADAVEAEEDLNKPTCTLFKLEFAGTNPDIIVRIRHMHTGRLIDTIGGPNNKHLFLGPENEGKGQVDHFKVIDLGAYFVLPKYVTFKGRNGRYLQACTIDGHPYLQFSSDNPHDQASLFEVLPNPDGSVRIKSNKFDRFWRNCEGWIRPESTVEGEADDAAEYVRTLFWPDKRGPNEVTFRSLHKNKYYCSALTVDNLVRDCLNADETEPQERSTLEVEEAVRSRHIYNLHYDLNNARICNQSVFKDNKTPLETRNKSAFNYIRYPYTETESQTWSSSDSFKSDVETTLSARIPFIVEGQIKISGRIEKDYQWGRTNNKVPKRVEYRHPVIIPPETKVSADFTICRASLDVPFSYTQCDTLPDGTVGDPREMDDGVFTGVNTYVFKVEERVEPLTKTT